MRALTRAKSARDDVLQFVKEYILAERSRVDTYLWRVAFDTASDTRGSVLMNKSASRKRQLIGKENLIFDGDDVRGCLQSGCCEAMPFLLV
jgi:hypothetical protein